MESISQTPDIVIVSAYGRGHWIAGELARKQWKVHLIDTTSALGAWAPEDWEGPWGFFDVADLTPSQRSRLIESDNAESVANGFTLWLKGGPLELNGELASFLSRAMRIPEPVRSYLQEPERIETILPVETVSPVIAQAMDDSQGETASEKPFPSAVSLWISSLRVGIRRPHALRGLERSHRRVRSLSFKEGWLAHFAHSLAANVYVDHPQALLFGRPLPLEAPYGVRHMTKESFATGLQALEKVGVRVTRNASIQDVRMNGRVMDALEVAAESRGVRRGRAFLWMLSSLESAFLSESVARTLFPSGPLSPSWIWTRFRFRLNVSRATQVLPLAFAILEDPDLPWTHTNLIMVKRVRATAKNDPILLDAWIRVPARVVGDRGYFESLGENLKATFLRRLPLSNPSFESLPPEASAEQSAARAPRFVLHEPHERQRLQIRSGRNLFVDSPELWDGLDWLSQLRSQRPVLAALERMKRQWDAAARREEVQA